MKILVKTSYTNLETIEANAPSVGTFEESLCLVTPDSKRVGEPYFKICNNVSFTKADSIARISFLEPKYIEDHKDESGKVPYKLSSKQIQQMIRFFDKTNKSTISFLVIPCLNIFPFINSPKIIKTNTFLIYN